ncbi:hypothetical protein HAALTHF_10230n [Vreelandella aquamarina]|nr:hypothetical protein HAALTHF_10230n [Halomonas axialensis]
MQEARVKAIADAKAAGLPADGQGLAQGGAGAIAYGDALAVFLTFALDKVVDRGSTITRWDPTPTQSGIINTFSRQAIPMTWDFSESNPLGDASGNFVSSTILVAKVMDKFPCLRSGSITQNDAATQTVSQNKVISTDPPYYDNIGYADLSDFFYPESVRPPPEALLTH